ncbi:hypothetical protein DLH98_26105 [Vibrio parahaemolyticus]|uniref:hypothetical protein n=1 Tax=Vibrio parahaemolyticus TaxID=670 RepID=UPI000425132C|nr:hypothetical protein [Vibrio parahaemolyticus]EGQ8924190.1 hypothetical protein [Vibrio parahaemolyticus]EGQ8927675.1 hypothetical protein [Vibrio parahaemolyticus]EGR2856119.1 hypothetical protein [Vibrio parahaemolyticus]EGR2948326.1 hypothetical protein [Vibrio parahaemolyticus]EGR2948717.1 hypothetical protein [Vibrio parahaemolyticus]
MRLKSLHTIWLTLCTTLILLVSSVVNSAPLMSLKMMSSDTVMSVHMTEMASENDHCGSPSMSMEMTSSLSSDSAEMTMSCVDGSGMIHNCCTASCSFVFVPLPVTDSQLSPLACRASIASEITAPVVQVTHDLYRPPIV